MNLAETLTTLPEAYETFLASYENEKIRAQGDDFEDFLWEHFKNSDAVVIDSDSVGDDADRVRAAAAQLKARDCSTDLFPANTAGFDWVLKHPFGSHNFPDFAFGVNGKVIAVEAKSGNNFTFIMFSRHQPTRTDLYILADFQKRRDLTFLMVGDLYTAAEVQALTDYLKTLEKPGAGGDFGDLTVQMAPTFRSKGTPAFSHSDRKNREARVISTLIR